MGWRTDSGFPQRLASSVVDSLRKQKLSLQQREWTVLAGIVAVTEGSTEQGSATAGKGYRLSVLTLGTGTKCLGNSKRSPSALQDSHGEIIARRALKRLLMQELWLLVTKRISCSGLLEPGLGGMWKLRDNVSLHLYVSDTPCGDASLLEFDSSPEDDVHERWTGAKPVGSWSRVEVDGAQDRQFVGVLRTKSGRSNMKPEDRTECLSCSDKISRWACLGLQGALLSHVLHPIHLASLVIGADDFRIPSRLNAMTSSRPLKRRRLTGDSGSLVDEESKGGCEASGTSDVLVDAIQLALTRAFKERMKHVPGAVCPKLSVTTLVFPGSRACVTAATKALEEGAAAADTGSKRQQKKRKQKNRAFPSGRSFNWIRPHSVEAPELSTGAEVTIANKGILQGASAKTSVERATSRLAKIKLLACFRELAVAAGLEGLQAASYGKCKAASLDYRAKRDAFVATEPFDKWLAADPSVDEFGEVTADADH